MSHTESLTISPHLAAERDRLLESIAQIRKAGDIAPAYCWLVDSPETKGTKTYTYIKKITERPGQKKTYKSLGKPGSRKHLGWKKAIARREAIAELEQQLRMVQALIDRQIATAPQVAIAAHPEASEE